MKVLTITPWYPSEKDQMAGLFVKNFVDETAKYGVCHEVFSGVSLASILCGLIRYSRRENRPDIVHLHVATKQGLIALFLRKFHDIPYVITEHWSGYYAESGMFERMVCHPVVGRLHFWFVRKIFSCSCMVTGVSRQLIERLKDLRLIERGDVLYNIVPEFFGRKEFADKPTDLTTPTTHVRFINVSCFDNDAKNLTGIIDAIKIIREKEFVFTFVGDGKDKEMVTEYAHSRGVDDKVEFVGEVEPKEVARLMRETGCLVLNSNYETACVVLQEALTVGLPIISTPVGIAPEFPEHIEVVETDSPKMLAEAMARFIESPKRHYEGITDFNKVPEKLYSIYETLLSCR